MQRMIFTVKNYVSNQICSDFFLPPVGKCVYTDFRYRFCIYSFWVGALISILYIHFCISLSNLRWTRICLKSVHIFLSLIFGALKLVGIRQFLFTLSTPIGDFNLCRRRASESTPAWSYSPKPMHHETKFEIHKQFPIVNLMYLLQSHQN